MSLIKPFISANVNLVDQIINNNRLCIVTYSLILTSTYRYVLVRIKLYVTMLHMDKQVYTHRQKTEHMIPIWHLRFAGTTNYNCCTCRISLTPHSSFNSVNACDSETDRRYLSGSHNCTSLLNEIQSLYLQQ